MSPEAVGWARRNRELLGLDVDLVEGDARTALTCLEGQVDVEPQQLPVAPRPADRLRAHLHAGDLRVCRLRLDREGDRPRAGAEVDDTELALRGLAARALQGTQDVVDRELGLGPRDEDALADP